MQQPACHECRDLTKLFNELQASNAQLQASNAQLQSGMVELGRKLDEVLVLREHEREHFDARLRD
jgi:hypothetical protein